jgi:signal transduction histidine kinase
MRRHPSRQQEPNRAWLLRRRAGPISVRWRLAIVYSGIFLVSGAALLAIVYLLVRHSGEPGLHINGNPDGTVKFPDTGSGIGVLPEQGAPGDGLASSARKAAISETLRHLLNWSVLVLLGMTAVSVVVGWILSGRVLSPVHEITARARKISVASLDDRLRLSGRNDELREMADTFDDLLDRIQTSVDSEKRLVATMSHELRTPLANQQVVLDVALGDPDASTADLRNAAVVALEQNHRANRTIESLLTLARAHAGVAGGTGDFVPTSLAEIVEETVRETASTHSRSVRWTVQLDRRLMVVADRSLLSVAVGNLIRNAVEYNIPEGHVDVQLRRRNGEIELEVANPGAPLDRASVTDFVLPFRRGTGDRLASPRGVGLGLAIVDAIVKYHQADLTLAPRSEGGLTATVRFPPAKTSSPR